LEEAIPFLDSGKCRGTGFYDVLDVSGGIGVFEVQAEPCRSEFAKSSVVVPQFFGGFNRDNKSSGAGFHAGNKHAHYASVHIEDRRAAFSFLDWKVCAEMAYAKQVAEVFEIESCNGAESGSQREIEWITDGHHRCSNGKILGGAYRE
jgi:hypothetical protein